MASLPKFDVGIIQGFPERISAKRIDPGSPDAEAILYEAARIQQDLRSKTERKALTMEEQYSSTEYPPEGTPSTPDTSLETTEKISSDGRAAAPSTKPLPEALLATQALIPEDPLLPQEAPDCSPAS